MSATLAAATPEPGTRLHFLVQSAKTEVPPPFGAVDFIYGPREKGGQWWQMEIFSQPGTLTNTLLFAIRGLTVGTRFAKMPPTSIFSATNFAPREPTFSNTLMSTPAKRCCRPGRISQKMFVPHAASGTRLSKGAPQTGMLLGQILTLDSVHPDAWPAWPEAKPLALDREVLIANSRNFKDTEGHRLPQNARSRRNTLMSRSWLPITTP